MKLYPNSFQTRSKLIIRGDFKIRTAKNSKTEYMKRVGSLIILDYTRDIICRGGLRRASVFSRLSLCIPVSGGSEIICQDKQFSFDGAPSEKLLRPYLDLQQHVHIIT